MNTEISQAQTYLKQIEELRQQELELKKKIMNIFPQNMILKKLEKK